MKKKYLITSIFALFLGWQTNAQVINEIYSAGGIAGGSWPQDYIILNGFTANQSVVGWSIQYRGTGTGWTAINLTGTADATGTYRIWLASTATGAPWTPQLSNGGFTMTNLANATNCAQVALMNNTTVIASSTCPSGVNLKDLVGYIGENGGTSCCFEGAGPAPVTNGTGTQSRRRTQETNNNAVDFVIINGPFPIELVRFDAVSARDAVNLSWSTASERDNAYFEVERSTDGLRFEKIAQVTGAGTSNTTQQYAFTDQKPIKGINYYRLRQVDFNGQFDFSMVKTVKIGANSAVLLAPNPLQTGNNTTLQFDSDAEMELTIAIFNTLGQLLVQKQMNVEKGINNLSLDTVDLPKGMYTLRIQSDAGLSDTQQLVVK